MNAFISGKVRTIALLSSLALVSVIFLPLWRIELTAPQYPEGLNLVIYANKLGGNVDVVNGLNHYIGMRTLHASDFPEFAILPYLIGFFSFLALLTGIIKRKWIYYLLVISFLLFAFVSMLDFYRWEYDYGHNLNPEAPIQVPGMSYQPPLLGFKQLLNFGVFSIPDTGGWIFIAVALALVTGGWLEWKRPGKSSSILTKGTTALMVFFLLLFGSCNTGPVPIVTGTDNCNYCRMTVTDNRFGAELITNKGKVFKFDDFSCLNAFVKSGEVMPSIIRSIYLVDFEAPHNLIFAEKACLLQGDNFKSPMGSDVAAFSNKDNCQLFVNQPGTKEIKWKEIWKHTL